MGKLYTRKGRGELWVTGRSEGERAHVLTSCGYVIEAHHVVESYGKACAIWREANAADDSEMKASEEDTEDAWRG
jgi:hypothetical protein